MATTLTTTDRAERATILEQFGCFITYPQAAELTSASVRTLKRLRPAGSSLPTPSAARARSG